MSTQFDESLPQDLVLTPNQQKELLDRMRRVETMLFALVKKSGINPRNVDASDAG